MDDIERAEGDNSLVDWIVGWNAEMDEDSTSKRDIDVDNNDFISFLCIGWDLDQLIPRCIFVGSQRTTGIMNEHKRCC
jgi:hypothetical protein